MIQHADVKVINWVEKNRVCTMSKTATFRPYQVEYKIPTKLNFSYATVVVRPIYDTVPTNLNYAGGRSSRAVHNSNKDDALIQQRTARAATQAIQSPSRLLQRSFLAISLDSSLSTWRSISLTIPNLLYVSLKDYEKGCRGVMGPQISLPSSVMAPAVIAADLTVVLVREVEMVEGIHALATAADKLQVTIS
jgi:hypothetical protein